MCIALGGNPTRTEPALAMLERDDEGFLLNASDWHPDLIEVPYGDGGLVMTPERCEDVDCIRSDFEKSPGIPVARVLLNHPQAAWDMSMVSHRDLYQLFPRGHGQQASKFACTRRLRTLMPDV